MNFWNFSETPEEGRRLELYGTIAEESWFDDDITPQMFRQQLNAGKGAITVYINSPGGDCIAASQIYTMLKEYPDSVTVKIDGLAASAASVVAMAGSKVVMSPTAMLMIHDPLTFVYGNKEDMKKGIVILNEVKESIINAYEQKTGLSRDKLSAMMSAETWMNAKKAVELGFADEILGEDSADAYAFESHSVDDKIRNKLLAKQPQGRKISDLKNKLETIKKFM